MPFESPSAPFVALDAVDGTARALGMGIAEGTRRRTFPQVSADCTFKLAELGADAGVVGAARVAMVGLSG
jgi:hypothetical protein